MLFETTLNEIADIVMGQSPPGEFCNQEGKGLPLLNGPTEFGSRHPSPKQFTTLPTKLAREGDILFCVRGSTTGKMNVADQTYVVGRGIAAIRGTHGYKTPYIKALIDQILPELLQTATGSTFPNLSNHQLRRQKVVALDKLEAEKVSEFAEILEVKTDINRQICATLEEMARTIFQSWFVNFDPVRAKVRANAEGRDPERAAMSALSGKVDAELDALAGETFASLAATSALFPDSFADSQAGQIPAGWTVEPLDQVADFLNGLALQKYPPNEGESLPVIKIAQLKKGGVEGADRASAQIPANFIVNDGDVLFSWSGSLEVDVWCGGRGALNQHLFKVTSEHFPKWFYYYWTCQHLSHFKAIASGKAVTMGHIQRHHLTQALCVVPPSDLLTRATAILQPLLDMQIANRLQNRQLQIIRDTLLPKLISGELPVSSSAGE